MVNYFFDTYALIAITQNNPNYVALSEEVVVTTKFNVAELVYVVLSDRGEEAARAALERFKDAEIEVPESVLFKAMVFRLRNKKKGLSYTDCIGYTYALENGLKFLTGDDAFKGMDNVAFVK